MPDVILYVIIGVLSVVAGWLAWRAPDARQTPVLPPPDRIVEVAHTPERVTAPRPQPQPVAVDLIDGKRVTTVKVSRRLHRLFYGGRAWDHSSTDSTGRWHYTPSDRC
jgi:hypothetical protein